MRAQPIERLQHDLDSLFHAPEFSNATFGVAIQSLKTGEYLYRLNDTKSLVPASNMKLFTAAEALAMLGPEYQYKTELLTNGDIRGHVLYGDLLVHGVGNPSFDTILGPYWAQTSFEAWADQLYNEKNLRTIHGNIIGNDSYFTDEDYPLGWSSDDLPYYYAPEVSSLAINKDAVDVIVVGAKKVGELAEWEINPSREYIVVKNEARTIAGIASISHADQPDFKMVAYNVPSIDITRLIGTDTIIISGKIPGGHDAPVTNSLEHQDISIPNPTRYAANRFFENLEKAKIRIQGRALTSRDTNLLKYHVLAIDTSGMLSQLIHHMNKESDNLYAECLFRTVAKVIGGEGSWTRGIEVMRKYLATIGIDTTQLQFTDGSGLSRMDLVTADAIVKLLHVMSSDPKLDSAFYNSLPIMGVDGTLESRLKGTPAQGNVHAKTGSMTGVRSISGYLTTRDGEPIVFSILANNYTCPGSNIGKLEDEVLLRLVNLSR